MEVGMENDPLNILESQAGISSAGETPPAVAVEPPAQNTPVIDDNRLPPAYRLAVRPARPSPAVEGLKNGYEIVADLLPVSAHKAMGQWIMRYKIDEDDPTWGNYVAGAVSFSSAEAAQKAAELAVDSVGRLPQIVQDAFFHAEKDVRADLAKVFGQSGGEFIAGLKKLITQAADDGAEKLKGASAALDGELTRKIELRKDEGVDLWVQRATDAANLAIAKHRAVNFYFNTIGGATIFILGAVFGAVLATHI